MTIQTITRKKVVDHILDQINQHKEISEELKELLIEMSKAD
jgi:hypothetical protein